MSLIKPQVGQEKIAIKIHIDFNLLEEIKQYCLYASFKESDGCAGFFEQAALYVLKKDTGFAHWKKEK